MQMLENSVYGISEEEQDT
jgi:hypothetical protein